MNSSGAAATAADRACDVEIRAAEALAAIARGWSLTPVDGKRPILRKWQSLPNATPEAVKSWCMSHNIGIRTGTPSGVVVIDVDPRNGGSCEAIEAATGETLPPTIAVKTGGDGLHLYFAAPSERLGNHRGRLPKGIDFKGEGGQCVFPGSIHPETGRTYRWVNSRSPNEIDLAPLPLSIVRLLQSSPSTAPRVANQQPSRRASSAGYGAAALDRECARIATAEPGERNDTLNRASFRVGQLAAIGAVQVHEATERLNDASQSTGLSETESRRTIESGFNAGLKSPRTTLANAPSPSRSRHILTNDAASSDQSGEAANCARPIIEIVEGELTETVRLAESALINARPFAIFQQGGALRRLLRDGSRREERGIHFPAGRIVIDEVTEQRLLKELDEAATFVTYDRRKADWRPTDAPKKLAQRMLASRGEWTFPTLTCVVQCPTMRPDGTVIQTEGYDENTGIWSDYGGVAFPRVPENPSEDQAVAALLELSSLFDEFPLTSQADLAVVLAAILTALIRPSLARAPFFGFSATAPGTGKGLLVEVVAIIATGSSPAVFPPTKSNDDAELRKRMVACLLSGAPVVNLDNIVDPLESATLCAMATTDVLDDRLLGVSRIVRPSTRVLLCMTGNALTVVGDLNRRVLIAELDAKMERPEERAFRTPDLLAIVRRERARLVVAGLTFLRGFRAAGSPRTVAPWGSFEDWSDFIRSALVWSGLPDPVEVVQRSRLYDPETAGIAGLIATWARHPSLGSTWVTCGQVVKVARLHIPPEHVADPVTEDLRAALESLFAHPNGAALGRKLSHYRGRVFGSLRLEVLEDAHSKAKRWRIARVGVEQSG